MTFKLNIKLFILILIGVSMVEKNKVQSVKLKVAQSDLTPNLSMDLEKLKEIEKQELSAPITKNPNEQEDLIKSLSSVNEKDLPSIKLEDLKEVEEESSKKFDGQTCESIKKLGQQKNYCESKFLLSQGEEKTVECMKSFCSVCCNDDSDCRNTCTKAHAFFSDHDPEEMFISVCSNKDMGPSFDGFCKSMLTDSDPSEYDQCITNFCFDCCSNELKINDFNDPEMVKCLGVCKPPKKEEEDSTPVPGTLATPQANEKETNDISNDLKIENKLMELAGQDDKKQEIVIHDSEKNEQILQNDQDSVITEDTDSFKVLADFSKKENSNAPNEVMNIPKSSNEKLKEPDLDKNDDVKEQEKNDQKELQKKESIDKNVESEKLFLKNKESIKKQENKKESNKSKLSDQEHQIKNKSPYASKDEYEESKLGKISKLSSYEIRLKEIDKLNKQAEKEAKVLEQNKKAKNIDSLTYTPEERERKNIKTCENLILTFSNIKNFGENINKHCKNNYFTNLFESYDVCLQNLCHQCCAFLDESKKINNLEEEIKRCEEKCTIKEIIEKSNLVNHLEETETKNVPAPTQSSLIKEELIHNIPSNKYLNTKIPIETSILESNSKDWNKIHFELIKSICKAKYFRGKIF